MAIPYKIRVKLGANEFEAEGPENVVKEQFGLFLEIAKAPVAPSLRQDPPPFPPTNGVIAGEAVSAEMLNRAFVADQDGQVSLRIVPRTNDRDADGLLILLYGFLKISNQADVLSGRLLRSAQTSGLSVIRVDRTFLPHMEFITKGGKRVGSRWGLNNRGIAKAEEIIADMLR
jgi:hypothetical protein